MIHAASVCVACVQPSLRHAPLKGYTDAAVASRPPTPRDEELVVEEPEYGAEDLAAVDAFMDDMGETAEDGTEDDMQSAREEESDGS